MLRKEKQAFDPKAPGCERWECSQSEHQGSSATGNAGWGSWWGQNRAAWKRFTVVTFSTTSDSQQDLQSWKIKMCPGWCGSVGWAPACKPKSHWFDSHLGCMPGLWARSPVASQPSDISLSHWCFSPSSSPSLPLSLKINIFLKIK